MRTSYPSSTPEAIKPTMKPRKLLDQLRDCLRTKHYAYRTEQAYVDWARRYILFHNKRHPRDMGGPEIEAFLTHLATERNVAASTQTQALCALLFLYKHVLKLKLPTLDAVRAKRPKRLPVVLSREVGLTFRQLGQMPGIEQVVLDVTQIASHTHRLRATNSAATQTQAQDNILATAFTPQYLGASATVTLGTHSVGFTGGNEAHPNVGPSAVVQFIIATGSPAGGGGGTAGSTVALNHVGDWQHQADHPPQGTADIHRHAHHHHHHHSHLSDHTHHHPHASTPDTQVSTARLAGRAVISELTIEDVAIGLAISRLPQTTATESPADTNGAPLAKAPQPLPEDATRRTPSKRSSYLQELLFATLERPQRQQLHDRQASLWEDEGSAFASDKSL